MRVDAVDRSGYTTTRRDSMSLAYRDDHYGEFAFEINGSAPKVEDVSTPNGKVNGKIKPDGSGKFDIVVTASDYDSETIKISAIPVDVSGNELGGTIEVTANYNNPGLGEDDPFTFSHTFTVTAPLEDEKVYYRFQVDDNMYKQRTTTYSFQTDTTAPILRSVTRPPLVDRGGEMWAILQESGVTIEGYSDNDLESAQLCYKKDGAAAPVEGDSAWATADVPGTTNVEGYKLFKISMALDNETSTKEGIYTIYYRLADDTGLYGDIGVLCKVFIDKGAPAFSDMTITPSGGSAAAITSGAIVYQNGSYTIAGKVTDGNGVASVGATKNGSDITLTLGTDTEMEKTFTYTLGSVEGGSQAYIFQAEDEAGNTTELRFTVYEDVTLPVIEITNPGTDNTYFDHVNPRLSATMYDEDSGLQTVRYRVYADGTAPKPAWTSASATGVLNISDFAATWEGLTYFDVEATDRAGNTNTVSRKFYINTDIPSVTMNFYVGADLKDPDTNNTHNLPGTYTVKGTVASSIGVQDLQLTENTVTQTITRTDGNWNMDVSGKEDGVYIYTVTVSDMAGKTRSATKTVRIDTTAPQLTIDAPVNGESTSSTTYNIEGTARDTGGVGIDSSTGVQYSLDNRTSWTAAPIATGVKWEATVDLGATKGLRTLIVQAKDLAGNTSEETVQFYYDAAPPVLTETAVNTTDTKYIQSSQTLSFGGSVSDDWKLADTNALTVSVNSGAASAITPSGGAWTYTFNQSLDQTDGTYPLVFTATDGAGKKTTVTRNVMVDSTDPDITVSTDLSGWFTTTPVNIAGTASDSGSGIEKIEYSTDNKANWHQLSGTTSWNGTVTVSHSDSNVVYIRATDRAGNYSEATRTIKADFVNPELTITSPDGMVVINGSQDLPIEITASDSGSGLNFTGTNTITIKVGSTDFTAPDAVAAYDGTALLWKATVPSAKLLAATQKIVYVQAEDQAGRTSMRNFQYLLDTTPPTASIVQPEADTKVNKTMVVSGTASDTNGLGSVKVQLQTSGDTWNDIAEFTGTAGFNWTTSVDTTVYNNTATPSSAKLRVIAADSAGNTFTTSERAITIDQDSDRPEIRLTNITAADSTLKMTALVYGAVTDDDGTIPAGQFLISTDGKAWDAGDKEWTALTLSNGMFSYNAGADGSKTLDFKVTDAQGTVFTTGNTAGDLTRPKVYYANAADETDYVSTTVTFRVDTKTPDIHPDIYIDIDSSDGYFTDSTDLADANKLTNGMVFGGDKSKFALWAMAKDANDIQSIVIEIDGTEYTAVKQDRGADLSWMEASKFEGYEIFITSEIDISAVSSGRPTVTIIVTDNSELEATASRQIVIDHTAPTVSFVSHADGAQVTGDIIVRGTVDDGNNSSGVSTVQWKIGKGVDESTPPTDLDQAWKSVEGSTVSWNVSFQDGRSNGSISDYGNDTYGTDVGAGLYRVPLWIRATDAVGNAENYRLYLNIDPNGDKPTVAMTYPTDGAVLGGAIRIFGSATDNESVDSVWMRIYDKDGNIFTGWDNSGEGKQVNGTTSWNIVINESVGGNPGEFDPDADEQREIRISVRSKDNAGNYSSWSDYITVYIDNDLPRIGASSPLRLVQYENADGTGAEVAEMDYVSGMWMRGAWYLVGSIEDDGGITRINISGNVNAVLDVDSPGSNNNASWFTTRGAVIETYYNYDMKVPVSGVDGQTGTITFTINVRDGSSPAQTVSQVITLKYDNKAPTMVSLKSGSSDGSEINNTTNPVIQSNNAYTIGSKVTEDGSGFKRLAFYFERAGNRLYDPMLDKTNTHNRIDIMSSDVEFVDGLWRLKMTVTRPTEDSLDASGVLGNASIRVGGLVRIGGVDRRISEITGTTVKFTPSVSTSYTDASFAYAQVVDNFQLETGTWVNGVWTPTIDDGDGMPESIVKIGTEYSWDASINSKNIPDGPITIYAVAYDEAGNHSVYSVATSVLNNRPRLAKVNVGTDLNGNGTFEASEMKSYNAVTEDEAVAILNIAYSSANPYYIKSDMAVTMDIVGGNGTLKYFWTYNGAAAAAWNGTTYPSSPVTGTEASLQSFTPLMVGGDATYLNAVVISASTMDAMDDILKLFTFSVWDSTDETTPGTDSQWALLNVPVHVDVVDTDAPVAVIDGFYWKSSTDNSLYNNSKDNGHIELGTVPAVSGKISIRGSAFDNQRLGALWMRIDNFTFTAGSSLASDKNQFGFAANGTNSATGSNNYYTKLAEYDIAGSKWVTIFDSMTDAQKEAHWDANGWLFTLSDPDGITHDGHSITWQLDWDSSKVTGVAAANIGVRVIAEDSRPTVANASSEVRNDSAVEAENNVPGYAVDVVPYITVVKTGLSSLKSNNPSVYNRTALGYYPVNSTEIITIYGFNLSGAVVTGSTVTQITGGITIPAANLTSGELPLTVNGISLLNNSNDNTAEYNKQSNGDNNLLLTDDVVLDVWQFDSEAARPISGMIEQPVMKINPVTGTIGFAFVNGPLYFSMGGTVGGTEYSSNYWMGSYDFFTSVEFTYDTLGYSYGSAAGGDINSASADKFQFMTSRWGRAGTGQNGSYGNTNSLRLESIGQTDSSGTIIFDKQRIKSPVFATAVHGTSTNVYLAYYDNINDEIRFKYGNINSNTYGNFGNFTDYDTAGLPYVYRNATVSMIAGNATGRIAGEYVAIAAISAETAAIDDVVVAVWYDATNRCLWYTYNDTPTTNRNGTVNAEGWSTPERVFDSDMENAGEYCQIMADKDGGIHIAAYDPSNLDLVYAYRSRYDASGFDTCVVDGYGVVGSNLTLDVAKDSDNNWIPYIGYYATSCVKPKYAYKVDTSANAPAGSEGERFTGAWEVTVLPTANQIPLGSQGINKMNVAVWKNSSTWVLENSITGTKAGAHSGAGYTATCWDRVYGNGTNNPVMGYAIRVGTNGYIETAQKK
ncbi:Ig-like domain-containing protein [Brucepastera parasyntrophica]|uniref:Ig-like domain-containing protein n=1 Tax=Brucepastera parasyntrophica TaxID=2880008 RepID=UPI00210D7CE2|nr:Ig-like domain-containing protein [Brucepastera parasyntrophica]ULQ58821.1 Ig-like domain-containing protein [Brucepastera parasyntrophica]